MQLGDRERDDESRNGSKWAQSLWLKKKRATWNFVISHQVNAAMLSFEVMIVSFLTQSNSLSLQSNYVGNCALSEIYLT
jgi:hypothetical protein